MGTARHQVVWSMSATSWPVWLQGVPSIQMAFKCPVDGDALLCGESEIGVGGGGGRERGTFRHRLTERD